MTVVLPKGIRQRKGNYLWDVTYRGVRKTGTTTTIDAAVVARAEAHQALREGGDISASKKKTWTLQKAFDAAYTIQWEGKPSVATHLKNARYVLKFFGPETLVDQIDEEAVDNFRRWLRDKHGNTNSTINRKTSCLSVILKHAYTRHRLDRLPHIGRMSENNTHERYVTREEEREIIRLFRQYGKDAHARATIVLVDTGMRSGELWALKEPDIDFNKAKHGVVTLWKQNTKTKRSRTIPLTKRAAEALKEQTLDSEDPSKKLFPSSRFWFHNGWERVREVMGLKNCPVYTPHLLRHTFGSRLAIQGVPIQKISYLMGHTTIKTTMRYAHLCPTAFEGVIDVLETDALDNLKQGM